MAQIDCDDDFKQFLTQFTTDLNTPLPKGYRLSQKTATKLLTKIISNKTVTINIVLATPKRGHPSNGNHSKIDEYHEFLV